MLRIDRYHSFASEIRRNNGLNPLIWKISEYKFGFIPKKAIFENGFKTFYGSS